MDKWYEHFGNYFESIKHKVCICHKSFQCDGLGRQLSRLHWGERHIQRCQLSTASSSGSLKPWAMEHFGTDWDWTPVQSAHLLEQLLHSARFEPNWLFSVVHAGVKTPLQHLRRNNSGRACIHLLNICCEYYCSVSLWGWLVLKEDTLYILGAPLQLERHALLEPITKIICINSTWYIKRHVVLQKLHQRYEPWTRIN